MAVRGAWEVEVKSYAKSKVMARINLDKFYRDLNDKLITANNCLEDSARELILSKN